MEACDARCSTRRRAGVPAPRERGAGRAGALGRRHRMGGPAPGGAGAARTGHRLLSYPRRFAAAAACGTRRPWPTRCRALRAADAAPGHRRGPRRRALVERRDRAPARARHPGGGPDATRPGPRPARRRPTAQAAFTNAVVLPAVERFRAGDPAAAVDVWSRGVLRTGYTPALERGLPGALESAVADAGTILPPELPALQAWTFTEEDARRIDQPVLVVCGEHSVPTFPERRALLLSWLPNAESSDLPGASHMLHAENPNGMAELLAAFFARHPRS